MPQLTVEAVPEVVEDDELPFVIGVAQDPRPCLEAEGVQFRRAADRCVIDYVVDPIRLRAVLLEADDGNCYLVANLGPLLNEWWPLLQRDRDNPLRPWLSAGAAQRPRPMTLGDTSVNVSIAPPSPFADGTMAVVGLRGGMTTDTLDRAAALGPAVIKAALQAFGEYRTLVGEVPAIDVSAGGGSIPLDSMLDTARQAAEVISWQAPS